MKETNPVLAGKSISFQRGYNSYCGIYRQPAPPGWLVAHEKQQWIDGWNFHKNETGNE